MESARIEDEEDLWVFSGRSCKKPARRVKQKTRKKNYPNNPYVRMHTLWDESTRQRRWTKLQRVFYAYHTYIRVQFAGRSERRLLSLDWLQLDIYMLDRSRFRQHEAAADSLAGRPPSPVIYSVPRDVKTF